MSGPLAMFRKGPRDGDIKKSAQKVSDHKKDAITRLKHLRHVLENYSVPEAKTFFETNYSHIYYIFNDNFASVEADLKQRANRAHREELDGILQIFEKILVLLPELVHKRWMFHSIGRVLKKLLHPGNVLKIRKDGMRLFLLWYQILQDNASEECHDIFLQLVPGLGDGVHQDALHGRQALAVDSCSGLIAAGEIIPILPSSGEKFPENITKFFFDNLIYFMVSEVTKVEWLNTEMRRNSFIFLFDKFKTKYVEWLLPDLDRTQDIYNPVFMTPSPRKMSELKSKDLPANVSECRYSYIKWLAHFVLISKQQEQAAEEEGINAMAEAAVPEEDSTDLNDQRSSTAERMPGSNASTLSTASHTSDQDSTTSSLCYEEFGDANEIVRSVFYSTRENINLLHESFRQALLFSLRHGKAVKTVIAVYKDWFQHVDQLPIFMQEPPELGSLPINGQRDTPELEFLHSSLSDIVEEENSSDESAPYSKDLVRSLPSLEASEKFRLRSASYLGAIGDLADGGETQGLNEVRAGVQKVLQVFIVNSANVFLLDSDEDDLLNEQVDLCKKVLNIYRFLVMNIKMEQKTWERMLEILLCITSGVLSNVPNSEMKQKTLGGRLASAIFQTVIVTWIKANLNVFISMELWDKFQQVLSSLTAWPELIREWAKTMETLTRVLAKQVYNLDLHDLPLQRLSEHKEIRRRGRSQDIPKNKVNEKSFSRGWSKSESLAAGVERTVSLTSAGIPFERGKYKSDGAGGGKSRPDLAKQRSLSGEPSPSHSRQPSNASDSALYLRRCSDGADPDAIAERLKGIDLFKKTDSPHLLPVCPSISVSSMSDSAVDASGPEDLEVSKITMGALETSQQSAAAHEGLVDNSGDSVSLEKSYQDNTFRYSRSCSPTSIHSRSPSPTSELTALTGGKGSPTPDRDSLHIDMVASEEAPISKESTEDLKSVLAGGTVQGWMADNAVVLWRRMLGSLGNVNKIEDADNHATVEEELSYMLETLNKMRDNLGVTVDNSSTPVPSELIPPIFIYSPWLFECLTLSNKYKRGKLTAYQLLCQMVVQRHSMMLPSELLSQFYMTLHQGLCSSDQDIINTLIRYCGSKFFSMPLPGSTLLIRDIILGAGAVISAVDLKETPRTEAMAVLGSLICFPNHYQELPILDQSGLTSYLYCNDFKEMLLNHLLRAGKKEPAGLARCVSLNGLGLFLYEELTHNTLHPKLNEAFIVLLGALRCTNRQVAKVASDVLGMLADHTDRLLNYHPQLPKLIIEVVAGTIAIMIPQTGSSASEEEKKLIVSMMFCMVEWCMKMPVSLLLETSDTDRSTLFKVFTVLDTSVKGHTMDSLNTARQNLSGMIQDGDFDNLRDISSSHRRSSSDSMLQTMADHFGDRPKQEEKNSIQLAAKTLINHLVNHYCHFPMGAGASRLSSSIQEHHDLEEPVEDLKPEIFGATNVQFFVLNRRTLVSLIELPALLDLPGGGVTAGLTTAQTIARVILRDLTGKYSWESAVLYAPPWCQQGSSTNSARMLLELSGDDDLESLIIEEENQQVETDSSPPSQRQVSEIPMFDTTQPHHDNLNDLLQFIGHSSPECLLIPGEPLNIEAPIPEGLSSLTEGALEEMVVEQKEEELEYYDKHKHNKNMLAQPQMPTEVQESVSPFQMCRMMLDQMGLLAWEKRCHFDLLKKSDKLLRELKNLDNQKCRETHKFAVIYVAEGQEDKNSILSNCGGSKAFEDFVAGLGWEVELEVHEGFLGGLQQNKTTGDTAPYYATSLVECVFHVSTRMPSGTDEGRHIKMRHLGNDEVHIVWSEHTRDYRRGIIPTEFGDVLIIIYPLPSGLYRIQINRKAEVPYFGPLFDGAILDRKVLPGLVRATAINASRVKRLSLPYYHSFYEERAKCFETVTQHHIDYSMFEEFAAKIFAPVLPQNSTISDQTADIPPSSSSSSLDHSQSYVEQVSPSTGRQSRGRKVQTALWQKGRDHLIFY